MLMTMGVTRIHFGFWGAITPETPFGCASGNSKGDQPHLVGLVSIVDEWIGT